MSGHPSQNLVKYAIAPKKYCARTAGGFSIPKFKCFAQTLRCSNRHLVQQSHWALEEAEAEEGTLF